MLRTKFWAISIVLAWSFGASTKLDAANFDVAGLSELNTLMLRLRATQFLQHATFGPTDADINSLANRMGEIGALNAAEEWIDQQFVLPATLHEATITAMASSDGYSLIDSAVNPIRYRYHAWWHNALRAPDQLRQRTTWALIQICVIGDQMDEFNQIVNDKTNQPSWMGVTNYYDMLMANAFGNYRQLMNGVTFHPIMGIYLSSLRNNKPTTTTFPDENYGREIMQLFSIGLYQLNQDGSYILDNARQLIPTYDNDEIRTFARLFTGMTYNQSTSFTSGSVNFHQPMMIFEANHDKDAKVVFNGVTLPANTATLVDINAGLDNLFSHPNVGPFICRQLIQRFVRSNPSRGYVGRVVSRFNNNGLGVRGDLKAVIKQILLDQEAWDGIKMVRKSNPFRLEVSGQGSEKSRLQEPVLLYTQFLRRYATSGHSSGRFLLPLLENNWPQGPYRSPSVFNFYPPNYQPPGHISSATVSPNVPNGDLVAPELELLDSYWGNVSPNRYRADVTATNGLVNYVVATINSTPVVMPLQFSFTNEINLAGNGAALAEYLDRVLCCGTMTVKQRTDLTTFINAEPSNNAAALTARAHGALLAVLTSPAYAVQE